MAKNSDEQQMNQSCYMLFWLSPGIRRWSR